MAPGAAVLVQGSARCCRCAVLSRVDCGDPERDQRRNHCDTDTAGGIRREHREATRNPVDDHATNHEQEHRRQQPRGKDE